MLKVAEARRPRLIAILSPTLALLEQTGRAWMQQTPLAHYKLQGVCSRLELKEHGGIEFPCATETAEIHINGYQL